MKVTVSWAVEGKTTIDVDSRDAALDHVSEMLQQFDLPNNRSHTTDYRAILVELDDVEPRLNV